ncbi:helix-turn-helix domain-containing protein [Bacillaceae bacterium C204]|uniref:helix-turn-helix domain-containing protein n=1 Tax=Neobacillus sp. 204 TaxID=3383351 RepID=UPI00397CF076
MFGIKLNKLRKEKGYSINKLSELTGISKSYLSLLEREVQNNPSIDIIEKIAKALEVDINYLIRSTEYKVSQSTMIKFEINLLEDGLNQVKLEKIKELFSLLGKDEENS